MDNFQLAMNFTSIWEGGFANAKTDPGGRTNYGITHTTYDHYRKVKGLPIQDVRKITRDEVYDIYRTFYWNEASCDSFETKLSICVFDFAVNSGPARAISELQEVVGAVPDGTVGPLTLQKISDYVSVHLSNGLVSAYTAKRDHFFRSIGGANLSGWEDRLHSFNPKKLGLIAYLRTI